MVNVNVDGQQLSAFAAAAAAAAAAVGSQIPWRILIRDGDPASSS
jgi:hypothetical protein